MSLIIINNLKQMEVKSNLINSIKIFKSNSYTYDFEKFSFFMKNQFEYMSKINALYSIKRKFFSTLNLDNAYSIIHKTFPYLKLLVGQKLEKDSSFIKIINRLFYVKNYQNKDIYFQIIYYLYDNTCENKMMISYETTLLSKQNEEKNDIKLYKDFINCTLNPFFKFFRHFCSENKNESSYISESIIIKTSFQKLFKFLSNIINFMKILYSPSQLKIINYKYIEIINNETKINTICSIYNIVKLNEECFDFQIKKQLTKENEIPVIYITHIKINPISNNLSWLCCDYPLPFGFEKSTINKITSVCKYLIKKIKHKLESGF